MIGVGVHCTPTPHGEANLSGLVEPPCSVKCKGSTQAAYVCRVGSIPITEPEIVSPMCRGAEPKAQDKPGKQPDHPRVSPGSVVGANPTRSTNHESAYHMNRRCKSGCWGNHIYWIVKSVYLGKLLCSTYHYDQGFRCSI